MYTVSVRIRSVFCFSFLVFSLLFSSRHFLQPADRHRQRSTVSFQFFKWLRVTQSAKHCLAAPSIHDSCISNFKSINHVRLSVRFSLLLFYFFFFRTYAHRTRMQFPGSCSCRKNRKMYVYSNRRRWVGWAGVRMRQRPSAGVELSKRPKVAKILKDKT